MADGIKKVHRVMVLFFFAICIFALGFSVGGYTGQQLELRSWEDWSVESCGRLGMCNWDKDRMPQKIDGIFFPDEKFYCVWTENRTFSQIEDTDRHEWCHHLIDKDRKHFCEDY